ncbi:MAG TPA: DUF4405 domain-containing protein [bacterium]|nr:DUF4405 domain-containing protein [bacterium]
MRSIASPLTIASFLGVAVTGLCLFFGVHSGFLKQAHEILSLIFVLGSVLHIAVNWKATVTHLRRPLGVVMAVLVVIVTVVAFVPHGDEGRGGNPVRKSVALMMDSDLTVVAALTNKTEPELRELLRLNGIEIAQADGTVRQIAAASNQNPMKVLSVLLAD